MAGKPLSGRQRSCKWLSCHGGPDASGSDVKYCAGVSAPGLDFWSFVASATRTLADEHGFGQQRATEVLLTLNRASDLVTYDLEASVHRPRGRSWSAFR